jgi:hypothetical protein
VIAMEPNSNTIDEYTSYKEKRRFLLNVFTALRDTVNRIVRHCELCQKIKQTQP